MGLIADIHKDLERGAFQLIVEYRARLRSEAICLCKDESLADDLVFRTFERVLDKADSYKVDTNLFGWMKSIMEHLYQDDMRRPVVSGTRAVEGDELERYVGADWNTDEQILKNSDSEAIRKAISELNPKYNQVLLMRYYDEFSLKQIADFLRLPRGTVSWRLHVAHRLLAGKLGVMLGRVKKPLAVLVAVLSFTCFSAAAIVNIPALAPVRDAIANWLVDDSITGNSGTGSSPVQVETVSEPTQDSVPTQQETTVTTKGKDMNIRKIAAVAGAVLIGLEADAGTDTAVAHSIPTTAAGVTTTPKKTNWVWTNNIDATSAATAAEWNDENNWDNGVPGEEDEAVFDSKLHSDQLVLPIERYVCIPEAGVKVGAITEKTGSVHLKFIGGPIRGLKGFAPGSLNYVYKLGPWLDLMFFCEMDGLDLSTTTTSGFYAPVSARSWATSDLVRGLQVVMGRIANAPASAVIENPFPSNVNNLACVGPIPREAQVLAGCVLTEGSKFVTCTGNAVGLLTAGAMVTCADYLPEGTYLKAIYATNCIELSQAPLASSAAATLNFAAYKPAVYQKMHLGNLNYTDGKTSRLVTAYQYFINPKNDFTIEFEGGLPPEATDVQLNHYTTAYTWEESGIPSSAEGKDVATKYIFHLSEGFAGMVTLGMGGAILSFPTNGQGRAGLSLDSRAQLYNRYGFNTFVVPEDVETEPITTIIGGSSSAATKEGPGTLNMMMTADSANGKDWYLNQGGLCFGHAETMQSFSVRLFKPQKDVKVIAATNAHILITIIQGALPASVIEAREGSALEFTNASGIGYSASNLVVGAASTLSFLTYKNDDSVSAINLIIGGRQTVDDSAAVLNSKLLLSGGIGVALSAERKIPGKIVISNPLSVIPNGGIISIDNRFGRVPDGTYEILEVTGGEIPSGGKWICKPTVEEQSFSAKVVNGKLVLKAMGNGTIIIVN